MSQATVLESDTRKSIRGWIRHSRIELAAFLFLLWMAGSVRWLVAPILRPDLHTDDATQHVWWAYRYLVPQLFPHDFIADFMSGRIFAPVGYRAIHYVGGAFGIDTLLFSNLVAVAIASTIVPLAYLLGRVSGRSSYAGIAAAIFAVASDGIVSRAAGGFPRSFAIPIVLLSLYGLLSEKLIFIGLAALAAAIFYPQSIVSPMFCAVVVVAIRIYQRGQLPKGWLPTAVLTAAAGVFILYSYGKPLPPDIGPTVSKTVARQMPEFGHDGRSMFWVNGSFSQNWIHDHCAGMGIKPSYFYPWVAVIAISIILIPRIMRMEGWILLITSIAAFGIAHLVLFKLYVPQRYVGCTLAVFALMWVAALGDRLARFSPRFFAVAASCATTLTLIVCAFSLHLQLHKNVRQDLEEAYAYLHTLPNDTLVASHPNTANEIPLRSQRSVLANAKTAHAYWLGYYAQIKPRIEAELAASYATDWADIDSLKRNWGANVFLVDDEIFQDQPDIQYFAPFREANLQRVARGRQLGFALQHIPPDRVLFHRGKVTIVELR